MTTLPLAPSTSGSASAFAIQKNYTSPITNGLAGSLMNPAPRGSCASIIHRATRGTRPFGSTAVIFSFDDDDDDDTTPPKGLGEDDGITPTIKGLV